MRIHSVTRGAMVIITACGLWLAGGSPAAAQTAPGVPQDVRTDPSAPAAAQFPEPPAAEALRLRRFLLDFRFAAGVPMAAFGDHAGASFGGGLDFGVRLGDTPVSVGAALEYLRYGTETRHVALFSGAPEVLSDVNTSNNVFWTHALVRVQPRTGRVRPYADGLIGFSYAYTSTGVGVGSEIESTTHLGDYAPSLGVGGGVTVLLASGPEAVVSLNLGLRYFATGDLDYLTKGAIQRDESGATFEPVRSPVNVVSPQIGLTLGF